MSQPRQLADDLVAAVGAGQGVYLVDDHEPQVSEQPQDVVGAVDEHGLQRLRRDLQDARRAIQQAFLVGHGDIAVPARDRDAAHIQQLVQAGELIVDQALQGRDIQGTDRARRSLIQRGQDGKEGGLGLAAGGRGGQEQVVVGQEQGLGRCDLHRPQGLPAVGVDVLPHELGKSLEYPVAETGLSARAHRAYSASRTQPGQSIRGRVVSARPSSVRRRQEVS